MIKVIFAAFGFRKCWNSKSWQLTYVLSICWDFVAARTGWQRKRWYFDIFVWLINAGPMSLCTRTPKYMFGDKCAERIHWIFDSKSYPYRKCMVDNGKHSTVTHYTTWPSWSLVMLRLSVPRPEPRPVSVGTSRLELLPTCGAFLLVGPQHGRQRHGGVLSCNLGGHWRVMNIEHIFCGILTGNMNLLALGPGNHIQKHAGGELVSCLWG